MPIGWRTARSTLISRRFEEASRPPVPQRLRLPGAGGKSGLPRAGARGNPGGARGGRAARPEPSGQGRWRRAGTSVVEKWPSRGKNRRAQNPAYGLLKLFPCQKGTLSTGRTVFCLFFHVPYFQTKISIKILDTTGMNYRMAARRE